METCGVRWFRAATWKIKTALLAPSSQVSSSVFYVFCYFLQQHWNRFSLVYSSANKKQTTKLAFFCDTEFPHFKYGLLKSMISDS